MGKKAAAASPSSGPPSHEKRNVRKPQSGKEAAAAETGVVNPLTGSPYSRKYYKLLEKRKNLPVWNHRKKILDALGLNQVVIVAAGSGSGKSTQIPQFVVEAGYASGNKQIACTQPRRMVTTCVSCRVAEEMDVKIGEEVGYSIRFEERSGPKTILKYLTDGMLLREALSDAVLEHYRVIILDEAHLRTLATDILISYMKSILNLRTDLKLIIMCTTVDAKMFLRYFTYGKIINFSAKLPSIEIVHTQEAVGDYIQAATERVVQIHETEPAGDILVFLPGEDDIANCSWRLANVFAEMGDRVGPVKILQVHSTLSMEMQKKIFKAPPMPTRKGGPAGRKILLSTDILESSLAVDGISYVVDSGLTKQKVYNPQLNVEALLILPVSKASAKQRSKCTRSQNGKCFRLYTRKYFSDALQSKVSPEILRANLAETLLVLKKLSLGFHFILFVDPPPPNSITRAFDTLKYLGALDGEGNLTKSGDLMSEFPLDPQMSKMAVSSCHFHCSNEILSIVAMLSVRYCFTIPMENLQAVDQVKAQFGHINGDHLTLLNVYNAYKKCNGDPVWCKENFINQEALKAAICIRKGLSSIMLKLGLELCSTDTESCHYYDNIRRAILAGYFMQAAQHECSGHYSIVKDHNVVDLHPSSCLDSNPTWVIYHDFVLASRNFIRTCTDVCGEWLLEIAPMYYKVPVVCGRNDEHDMNLSNLVQIAPEDG